MRARLLLLPAASAAFGASLGSGFHLDDYAIFTRDAKNLRKFAFIEFVKFATPV
jgi:hypothetical protein